MKKLFAFWRHDTFPYVLGGNITKMDKHGNVETMEYGRGRYFKPIKILPKAAGQKLLVKLEDLRAKKREFICNSNREWLKMASAILPEINK